MSLALKISDMFKTVRSTTVFLKWIDLQQEEFNKQGEMEKNLELPVTKFIQMENIDVICKPLFVTYLIMADDEIKRDVINEGTEKNKKNLENRVKSDVK